MLHATVTPLDFARLHAEFTFDIGFRVYSLESTGTGSIKPMLELGPVSAVVLFSACHAHAKSFSCPQRQSLYICGGPDWTVQSAYATQGPFPVISTHTCALQTHGAEKTKRLGAGPCTHFC